jgi:hypothetical protein
MGGAITGRARPRLSRSIGDEGSGLRGFRLWFCNAGLSLMTAMPDEQLIYGCVGADRPEAQPFIDEIDGVLYYTCPECREELAKLGFPLRWGFRRS